MARAIYNYTKTILEKVSFDAELFSLELKKAVKKLLPHEIKELKIWLTEFISKKKPEFYYCLSIVE